MKRYVKPKVKVHIVAVKSIIMLSAGDNYDPNEEVLIKDRGDNEWEEF